MLEPLAGLNKLIAAIIKIDNRLYELNIEDRGPY